MASAGRSLHRRHLWLRPVLALVVFGAFPFTWNISSPSCGKPMPRTGADIVFEHNDFGAAFVAIWTLALICSLVGPRWGGWRALLLHSVDVLAQTLVSLATILSVTDRSTKIFAVGYVVVSSAVVACLDAIARAGTRLGGWMRSRRQGARADDA